MLRTWDGHRDRETDRKETMTNATPDTDDDLDDLEGVCDSHLAEGVPRDTPITAVPAGEVFSIGAIRIQNDPRSLREISRATGCPKSVIHRIRTESQYAPSLENERLLIGARLIAPNELRRWPEPDPATRLAAHDEDDPESSLADPEYVNAAKIERSQIRVRIAEALDRVTEEDRLFGSAEYARMRAHILGDLENYTDPEEGELLDLALEDPDDDEPEAWRAWQVEHYGFSCVAVQRAYVAGLMPAPTADGPFARFSALVAELGALRDRARDHLAEIPANTRAHLSLQLFVESLSKELTSLGRERRVDLAKSTAWASFRARLVGALKGHGDLRIRVAELLRPSPFIEDMIRALHAAG
jgi:hypothetical protein